MTAVRHDDPRAYRIEWWSLRDPRTRGTVPARRPYLTVEEADKRVAEMTYWEPFHVKRVGPFLDERSLEQRRRDDLLATVTAFIKEVDQSDFRDESGQELRVNRQLMALRMMTLP
jgi:hypothetical protein